MIESNQGWERRLAGLSPGLDLRGRVAAIASDTGQPAADIVHVLDALRPVVGGIEPALEPAMRIGLTALATGAGIDDITSASADLIRYCGLPARELAGAWDAFTQASADGPVSLRALATDLPRLIRAGADLGLVGRGAADTLAVAGQILLPVLGGIEDAATAVVDWFGSLGSIDAIESFAEAGINIAADLAGAIAAGGDPVRHALGLAAGGNVDIVRAFGPTAAVARAGIARLADYDALRPAVTAAAGVVDALAATIYRPGNLTRSTAPADQTGRTPAQMARLGDYGFGLSSLAYDQLRRVSEYRWPSQERLGRHPARQFVGPGEDTITLPATLYPWWRGGYGQVDRMRAMALAGEPLLLTLSDGQVLGWWVILRIDETSRTFAPGGRPRAVDVSIELAFYGEDAPA